MVRHLLTAAAGAAAVAVVGSADGAAAGTGTFLYGAANDAGPTETTLASNRAAARTLTVTNAGAAGFAYGGEAENVYGGHGTTYAMNVTAGYIGVVAQAPAGGLWGSAGTGAGVQGTSNSGAGVLAQGGRCDLQLLGSGDAAPGRLDAHAAGEVLRDRYGDVWCCVVAGTPGTWRKIAGPATAGSLHAIEPTRVYDSRWPAGGGPLASGTSRGIDVSAGRNLVTGAIETANVVPPKATALQYTITVTDTAGSGFVAVTSIAATAYKASTANWSGPNQSIANSTMARLTSPELRLWCGGGGSTHVIVDVLGYHL